ncbi:uncharacterized protein V6R79_002343 [Siganus canaliculatus]
MATAGRGVTCRHEIPTELIRELLIQTGQLIDKLPKEENLSRRLLPRFCTKCDERVIGWLEMREVLDVYQRSVFSREVVQRLLPLHYNDLLYRLQHTLQHCVSPENSQQGNSQQGNSQQGNSQSIQKQSARKQSAQKQSAHTAALLHEYTLTVHEYTLTVHEYTLTVHEYTLTVHEYTLTVHEYTLTVHEYTLTVHEYTLTVHECSTDCVLCAQVSASKRSKWFKTIKKVEKKIKRMMHDSIIQLNKSQIAMMS